MKKKRERRENQLLYVDVIILRFQCVGGGERERVKRICVYAHPLRKTEREREANRNKNKFTAGRCYNGNPARVILARERE